MGVQTCDILGFFFFYVSLILPPDLQLKREKLHLESELERAERESATYVTEVREVSFVLKKKKSSSSVYWPDKIITSWGHFALNCDSCKLDLLS